MIFFDPVTQMLLRDRPEWNLPLLASFAVEKQVMTVACYGIRHAQGEDLRDAGSGVVQEQKKQVIAASAPGAIRSREKCFDFLAREEAEQGPDRAFARNRQHAPRLLREVWTEQIAGVMKEGTHGGQPGVAAANAIAPVLLQMREEGEDALGGECLQGQSGWGDLPRALEKAQEQPEGIAVGGHGAGAHIALLHQMFGEEPW
jgi:hypothetical protein